MTLQKMYLKPNVVIEPLVDRWYAWAHLISPATAAMNIAGRHLKIMNSYIQAPQIHAAAVRNPKMKGGPFMDFPTDKSGDIKTLRDTTANKQKDLLQLAEDIKSLSRMLQQEANGYSLHPLYEKVPDSLRGYVELTYDLNHSPSFRFFEPLLYKSKYYSTRSQSIAIWATNNDERPFVLSTPRLNDNDVLFFDVPFSHDAIDTMHQMRTIPGDINFLMDMLNVDKQNAGLFMNLFTNEAPSKYEKYDGDKVRMRYFGHACILIETKELSILVDPVISYYGYQTEINRYSYADLPETIDYVLITHNHQDHVLLETLLALRYKIKNIIVPRSGKGNLQDPCLKLMLNSIGFKNVSEIDEMETLRFANCDITGVPFLGEHADLDIKAKICHHVKIGKFSMLFVADSCNVEPRLYKHVQKIISKTDVVFLGMECDGAPLSWLYGPLLNEDLERDKDQSRRLAGSNFERGKALIDVFEPKEVYVYAMGQEPWLEFISSIKYTVDSNPIVASNRLIEGCIAENKFAERLFGEKELFYDCL